VPLPRVAFTEEGVARLTVRVSGKDAEHWAGNFGSGFALPRLVLDRCKVELLDASESARAGAE